MNRLLCRRTATSEVPVHDTLPGCYSDLLGTFFSPVCHSISSILLYDLNHIIGRVSLFHFIIGI